MSYEEHRTYTLRKYCDILPIPTGKWIRANTYTEEDIAFVIFTGFPFYRTRATSIRETWLSRTSTYYFLSATPDPYLPVTVVNGAGEDRLSNMKKLFYGLQIIYQQEMKEKDYKRRKWFYIAGCDTFVFVPHLLKRLDGLDYTKPMEVGSDIGTAHCPSASNKSFSVRFPSGGAGFFLSFALLELMQPHLTNYIENIWPRQSELSDVALTCLAAELGVQLTNLSGSWRDTPMATLQEHGHNNLHSDAEINTFHYVPPHEMYSLDEFFVFQHIERLTQGYHFDELVNFINKFVATHYELLRMKRKYFNSSYT